MSALPLRDRSARRLRDMHFGPSMTPMVDVVMVILIFFMASMSFIGTEWFLRSALPTPAPGGERLPAPPAAAPALPPARFDITLAPGSDGDTIVRGTGLAPVPLAQLESHLRRIFADLHPEDVELVIRAADAVPYGDVIRAHDAALAAGVSRIGLTDVPPPP